MIRSALLLAFGFAILVPNVQADLTVDGLRCEYLANPLSVDSTAPRLSWLLQETGKDVRGQKQTAYRILVASTPELLAEGKADLWDSAKTPSNATLQVVYAGKELTSRNRCWWKVKVWDKDDRASEWSPTAFWQIGLLKPSDWSAEWISFRDTTPIHTDRKKLDLPPARYYQKEVAINKPIRQATVYASALGNFRFSVDSTEVGDGYFLPGWSDYKKRAYYRAYDVTEALKQGRNRLEAIVTEGWYAGYVGYGLLVGYGPHRSGKNFYGKTPALRVQLEIEYSDGSRETIGTDTTWKVSSDGPIREADIIMGESYDATKQKSVWESAIAAHENGSHRAPFFDTQGQREVELGFEAPPTMASYPCPSVRVVESLPALAITEPQPGIYVFDLGRNFAGVVRLRVQETTGRRIQLRYGEMLHPDGQLMIENLRRARATDSYICSGAGRIEEWTPQFTYHGFRFVEISGLTSKPTLDTVTGLVLTNDLQYDGTFACSDEVLTQFWRNGRWTQQANFIDIPTDCPQRDERLGWMGDAQAFVRTASYNADIAPFFTKWLSDLEEAQRESGVYPDYAPYPMAHGGGKATFGTAWMDAGIICPWTIWKVYDDRRLVERLWESMSRFMDWRAASDAELKGIKIGNPWGDWLNVGEETPIEYIDLCYHAYDCLLMSEMAIAVNRPDEASRYDARRLKLLQNFRKQYIAPNGGLNVATQSAYVLAIGCRMIDEQSRESFSKLLAAKLNTNGSRMATGFLGTKSILPALTSVGQHDLACRLFQSREFPSWGYEVVNGATSVWERWDSYTREHGFDGVSGKNNAAMNSFSHYAFGAVMEWGFRDLVGIDTDGPGFHRIVIKPGIPSNKMSNIDPSVPPITWAKANFAHHRGMIRCEWRRSTQDASKTTQATSVNVEIPPNTTAKVHLPTNELSVVTESGKSLQRSEGIAILDQTNDSLILEIQSGKYRFEFP